MKIGLISLNQAWEDKEKNLKRSEKLIRLASQNGASLSIFPEMTLTGYTSNPLVAETYSESKTVESFKNLAIKYNIKIVFGISINADDKLMNRLVFVDENGEIVCHYDKIHPFSFVKENQFFKPGENLGNIQLSGIGVSFSICYDLRFPEIFAIQATCTSVFINIANWPKSRSAHFKALLKARAIENQAFMIGVNRTGYDNNGIAYSKSSQCYDPYGIKVKPYLASTELDIIEIDTTMVTKYRNSFSCIKDKRVALYKNLMLKA